MNEERLYDVYRVETVEDITRYTYVPSGDFGLALMRKLEPNVRAYGIIIDGEGLNWNYAQNKMWALENGHSLE